MPQSVVDHSSNAADNIAHAARVVGRGYSRRAVFNAIYTGKQQVKTAKEIAKTTKLNEIRVLQEGKKLSVNHIVTATKVGKYTAYQKIDFFHHRKKQILDLAASSKKLAAFPTKVNPGPRTGHTAVRVSVQLRIPKIKHKARHLTVDDIDNFDAVQAVAAKENHKISETQFKNGVAAILGEQGPFKDWGGESRDLSSTRVRLGGKRRVAAFAFKGPGQTGKLTPGRMGKNGDQIQRLVRCPAEIFIIQYWAQIDDSVIEQLKALVTLKSYLENEQLWWGIMDGNDSARLIAAYPKKFAGKP
jgi:hypothetical protein